jgi:hypothetical protein
LKENKAVFYHSKGKLFLGIIFSLMFVALGVFVAYIAVIEESILIIALSLFIVVLFSIFAVANLLKLIRGNPYIIITEDYLRLDPFTKSEVTIYFDDIDAIKVSEVSFQQLIEIVLYDEDAYFHELSFHNKIRLFMNRGTGFSLFTISVKAIRKKEREALLDNLDRFMNQKLTDEASTIEMALHNQHEKKEFMEKYDPTPPADRSIDRSYFLKAYKYGLILFAFAFVIFYLMIGGEQAYLVYIIVSFLLFPFAKVLIDWLFGFKLRHKLDKQKGFTYYFDTLLYMFDFALFHLSFFIAPIGIIFLFVRYIVIRIKQFRED